MATIGTFTANGTSGFAGTIKTLNRGDIPRLRSVHRKMCGLPVLAGDVRAPGPITAQEVDDNF